MKKRINLCIRINFVNKKENFYQNGYQFICNVQVFYGLQKKSLENRLNTGYLAGLVGIPIAITQEVGLVEIN